MQLKLFEITYPSGWQFYLKRTSKSNARKQIISYLTHNLKDITIRELKGKEAAGVSHVLKRGASIRHIRNCTLKWGVPLKACPRYPNMGKDCVGCSLQKRSSKAY